MRPRLKVGRLAKIRARDQQMRLGRGGDMVRDELAYERFKFRGWQAPCRWIRSAAQQPVRDVVA